MSKKKNKKVSDEGQKKKEDDKEENQQQKGGEDGGAAKKDNNNGNGGNAVVLKIDLHCDGCVTKIVKCIRGFEGVEAVKVDSGSGKITVSGKVDPLKLREKLEDKTHKKVELLSPVPKKDKAKNDDAGDGKEEKKKDSKEKKPKDNSKNKKDEKNSKELPVTTAVLKVPLHCQGCIERIHKIVSKTKGYQEMKVDRQKDLVTVKGAMDMKDVVENLKKHLKRDVEIVPAKKEDKKEKSGGGGGEGKPAGGEGGGGEQMEGSKKQLQQQQQIPNGPLGYDYPSSSPFVYGGPAYMGDPYQFQYHAPQLFSDENPNACSVM
ncbi:unnamed protein product [Coffea canephora]|uniref:HMA domain-containing protein n=1 Tax=Coffea canephora TaxID=49390 RepID=A0A068UFJ1_COFCA|nr:unnamed protein product [Coffea canephora]